MSFFKGNGIVEEGFINQEDMIPGFEIICKRCNSKNVYIENDMGFSEISGGWGSIDVVCNDCKNRTVICEN